MKQQLIQLLSGSKGRFVSLGVGAAIGSLSKLLSAYNFTIDPEIENFIAALIGLGITWVIDSAILYITQAGVKKIQAPLPGIAEDGVPGPKTIAAVEKAVDQANENAL